MDPISLVSFFLLLRSFAQGAKVQAEEDEELISMLPPEFHAQIRSTGKRILRLGYVGVATSLVFVPIAAPFVAYLVDGISVSDAFFRGVLLLCFAPMTFFLGAYWGLSLGMLTSPRWYLGTELGLRWREMCGADSVSACRLISLTVSVVGTGCYVLLFWLTRAMAPFT
ncbi:hypothetical protein NZK35_33040 [Stieleria sp. ICT_E10.1]|uniref:hypothetical protein n=1 Tax=Stieleria sedimenti TaxID=2976331 RepID=UPI00217FC5A8|nr:hypothetical protein [Stieleria sedimenti]MCS7471500.1 hypothetical protein [Stieleria sedimenti]